MKTICYKLLFLLVLATVGNAHAQSLTGILHNPNQDYCSDGITLGTDFFPGALYEWEGPNSGSSGIEKNWVNFPLSDLNQGQLNTFTITVTIGDQKIDTRPLVVFIPECEPSCELMGILATSTSQYCLNGMTLSTNDIANAVYDWTGPNGLYFPNAGNAIHIAPGQLNPNVPNLFSVTVTCYDGYGNQTGTQTKYVSYVMPACADME